MMYGESANSLKVPATPKAIARCPDCKTDLIAKCGTKNIWHWAHSTLVECQSYKEPETEWHRAWKAKFPPYACEIKVGDCRADVRLPTGTVIEFQHSPIDLENIYKREKVYGTDMIWFVDGYEFSERFYVTELRTHANFQWDHRRKWVSDLRRPIFIDFLKTKSLIFQMVKNYGKYGWGYVLSEERFMEKFARDFLIFKKQTQLNLFDFAGA